MLSSPPPPPPRAPAGDLSGRWVGEWLLVRKLGQGGMGSVYLAHGADGQLVAVKVLHPALAADDGLVARFHAEAKAASQIGHPSIVAMRDLGHAPPDLHYLVMEYLWGRPLSRDLEGGALPLNRSRDLIEQILAGLAAAHVRGVVHRDLKPDNLYLVTDAIGEQLKILDFGVAKLMGGPGSGQTVAGTLVGTPEYMAPEQVAGEHVDARADLYAVGVIAYRLLTGVLPFTGPTVLAVLMAHQQDQPASPSTVNPAVPEAVSAVVMRALAKEASGRFPSAQAMRQEWTAAFQTRRGSSIGLPALGKVVEARPATPVAPPPLTPVPPGASAPGDSTPGALTIPAPMPLATLFEVRVVLTGRDERALPCVQVTPGGLLLAEESAPWPLRARLAAVLELPGGHVPVTLEAVGHVSGAQARSWGTRAGHWVQLVQASPEVRGLLQAYARGVTPTPGSITPPVADDPEVERLLRTYAAGRESDPYQFLELPSAAPVTQIRVRVRSLEDVLSAALGRRLSTRQRQGAEAALARIRTAADRLLTPGARARLDAERGDLAGVARAITAGISVTELSAVRDAYLVKNPGAGSRSRIHQVTAQAWEARGKLEEALLEYERALKEDPLHLVLHQRYWPLRQKVMTAREKPR